MALSRDQLNQVYRKRLKRDVDESGYGTYSVFNSLDDVDQDLQNSDEYRKLFEIQPLGQDDYTRFGQEAQKMYDPLRQASSNRLTKFREASGADQRDLETRLRENATKSIAGLEEGLNSRGLLQSGLNAAGQGAIQRDTTSQINRAEIQRAIEDANRVLEDAQFNTELDKRSIETTDRLAEQEYTKRANTAKVNQNNLLLDDRQLDQKLKQQGFDLQRYKTAQDLLQDPFIDEMDDNLLQQLLEGYGLKVTA